MEMYKKRNIIKLAIAASIIFTLSVCATSLPNQAFAANNKYKKPGATSIKRIGKTDSSITVKLAKAKRAKGYQVKVSTSEKYASSKTKKSTVSKSTYKSNSKMVSVRSLKKKTDYYVKARAYNIKKNGKKVYGKWSSNKTCKTAAKPKLDAPVKKMLKVARNWIGYSEANKKHLKILKVYNSQKKLPVNYAMQASDPWCAAFVSAVCIKADLLDITYTECGCWRMAKLYHNKKLWVGKKGRKPNPGDIIFYDWDAGGALKKPTSTLDHVGIVESVDNNIITTIEGNYKDAVKRRTILTTSSYIAGYATPKYSLKVTDNNTDNKDTSDSTNTGDNTGAGNNTDGSDTVAASINSVSSSGLNTSDSVDVSANKNGASNSMGTDGGDAINTKSKQRKYLQ